MGCGRPRRRFAAVVLSASAIMVCAPRTGAAGQTLRVSSDEAVAIALDHNLALKSARIGPALADLDVQTTGTAWTPSLSTRVGKTDGRTPAATPFDQGQTSLRTGQLTSDVALTQQLLGIVLSSWLARRAPHEQQRFCTVPAAVVVGTDGDIHTAASQGSLRRPEQNCSRGQPWSA